MTPETIREEINDAVTAHSAWKTRLRSAAQKNETGLPVAEIRRDDCCRLGKWLRTVPAEIGGSHLEKARRLHADFHEAAGDVAAQIHAGRKHDALAALEEGDFPRSTTALVLALGAWRNEL